MKDYWVMVLKAGIFKVGWLHLVRFLLLGETICRAVRQVRGNQSFPRHVSWELNTVK
jgi:hypothetical protein